MNVLPKPAHPLDVWLGGKAPSELRRVGRLADGWLASFTTPEQCKAARVTVEEAADAAGREIDPEHFGVMALYTHDAIPDAFAQAIKTRNPDVEIDDLVARGCAAAARPVRALHRGRLLEARARPARRARELGRRARRERRSRSSPSRLS